MAVARRNLPGHQCLIPQSVSLRGYTLQDLVPADDAAVLCEDATRQVIARLTVSRWRSLAPPLTRIAGPSSSRASRAPRPFFI